MKRFAIYFAPPVNAPLTRLASAWLGRSAEETPRGAIPEDIWRETVADPRAYGFHATLKPPFRLQPGTDETELFARARDFAAGRRPFAAPPLRVASLSSFLALTLSDFCPEFEALAADCVREFDRFRLPPSEEELARRRRAKLSPKQLEYLGQWGYPYVMEEWRFHMTLTSSLAPPLFTEICTHLTGLFDAHCREPFRVDSMCLFEQAGPGELFEIAARFPFA